MRDYGSVSPSFWIGETGKVLRGNAPAQLIALYLMTGPHSTMTGVFHCPIIYISYETGTPLEGASKGLQDLINAGFCEYDEKTETVFVINMALYQIAESLKAGDNRIAGLKKDIARMGSERMKSRFLEVHGERFNLVEQAQKDEEKPSPFEAPSKPLRSQEQEQEQDKKPSLSGSTNLTDVDQKTAKVATCPIDVLIDLYEKTLPSMPRVRRSLFKTGKNGTAMRQRWVWVMTSIHERGERAGTRLAETAEQGVAWFDRYFAYVADSKFLTESFAACDLGWLLAKENFEKVLGGRYENREGVAA